LLDKPYLGVDTGAKSRFRGSIYVSYGGDFTEGGYTIHVVVSSDGGRTWSSPARVSRVASFDTDDVILGSIPVVASDGTAYVFYTDGNERTGPSSIRFVKSTNGGNAGTGDAVYIVWGDERNQNNVEIYAVRGDLLP